MLEVLDRGVYWLTSVCHVAWCTERGPKDWQTGVIIPMRKKEDRSECNECTNYRGISLLSIPGKVYAKCIEDTAKYLNQSWSVPAVALQTKISLSSQFSRNIGSIYVKDVYTCFVEVERAYDRVLREKLWGVLREHGVDDRRQVTVFLFRSLRPCRRN